jgi:hypothetical protein
VYVRTSLCVDYFYTDPRHVNLPCLQVAILCFISLPGFVYHAQIFTFRYAPTQTSNGPTGPTCKTSSRCTKVKGQLSFGSRTGLSTRSLNSSYPSALYSFAFDFSALAWMIPKFHVVCHQRSCQFPQRYPEVMDADEESVESFWLVVADGMRDKAKL